MRYIDWTWALFFAGVLLVGTVAFWGPSALAWAADRWLWGRDG